MNKTNNLELYAAPDAVRLFWGYKREEVPQDKFYKDLGETFMPGTPAVLAPLGLNGYLPAVLGLNDSSKYPDEVALIVYPSLQLYGEARQDNLLGRIYTYSHMGVFDMVRSRGHWPGTVDEPNKHNSFDRWAWRVLNTPLDWQKGQCRLVTVESTVESLFDYLQDLSKKISPIIKPIGIEEMIIQCTQEFATIWFYSNTDIHFDLKKIGISNSPNLRIHNDLFSEPFNLREGNEIAEIEGPKFIQFRFPRELKYYI